MITLSDLYKFYEENAILGGQSKIIMADNKISNKRVVVKIVKKSSIVGIENIMECIIMSSIKHPNINRAINISQDDETVFIEQNMAIGSLKDVIATNFSSIDDLQKHSWLLSLSRAVNILHGLGIIHGDIKSENVLIFNNHVVKLNDFGMSVEITQDNKFFNHKTATCNYRPPECINDMYWSSPIDLWSLGCVFYAILYGRELFKPQKNDKKLKLRLLAAIKEWFDFLKKATTIPKFRVTFLPPELHFEEKFQKINHLIFKMLRLEPSRRPKITEVVSSLQNDERQDLSKKECNIVVKNNNFHKFLFDNNLMMILPRSIINQAITIINKLPQEEQETFYRTCLFMAMKRQSFFIEDFKPEIDFSRKEFRFLSQAGFRLL